MRSLVGIAARHGEVAAAAIAIVAAVRATGFGPNEGFPLDDAWIHMVYGRALATAGAFEYDPGVPGSGATSPVWAVVAALAHLVVGGDDPLGTAFVLKLFGVTAHATSAWLAGRLARACSASLPAALIASLVVATSPQLAFAAPSGMEVPLASALLLALFLCAVRGRVVATGALAGLALLARPESLVAVPVAFWLVLRARTTRDPRATVAAAFLAIAPPGAWAVRGYLAFGTWIPQTVAVKSFSLHGWARLRGLVTVFHDMLASSPPLTAHALTLLALVAIPVGLRRRGHLPAAAISAVAFAWLIGIAVTTPLRDPKAFYFLRYVLPVVPLLVVAAVSVLAARLPPKLFALAGMLVAAIDVVAWPATRATFRRDVAAIDDVQVPVGRFIDGALRADAVVWSPDAGAIRYFGRRRVLDIGGLNTASVLRAASTLPSDWSATAAVLHLPYGHRADLADGRPPWIIFEAPTDWRSRPPPPGAPGPVPDQIVVVSPPGYDGIITVTAGGATIRARWRAP